MLLWMRNRLPALVVMGALVVLAGVVARGTSSVPLGQTRPLLSWFRLPNFNGPEFTQGSPRESGQPLHGWWSAALERAILLLPLIMLGLALAAALIVALRMRKLQPPTPVRRGEPGLNTLGEQVSAMQRAVHAAARVLAEHEGGPPGDAVIAAWLELERVAALTGAGKQAHQTPTEFTDALVAEHADIQRAIYELRKLYHRARFGQKDAVGRAEADTARRALEEIAGAMVPR
jgi:hypothetical protein